MHENEHCIYKDITRPIDERVADLISRMSLEEKCTQLLHNSLAISRLDVQQYDWWNECLHGVARAGKATVFPQAIGMAATFDPELILEVAAAISDEVRAKYNAAQRINNYSRYRGLTCWSPNINIFRDPRWGRGQETYGEDPFLTAAIGTAFVKGLQGDDLRYMKTAACAKHFAVHSGPEKLRHRFNAVVNKKDLFETYLPAFKALVDAGVESVMGAYNRVNGEPCCGSKFLLVDLLRGAWKFKGHIVSDCWAIQDFHEKHKITATPEESLSLALNNGCDLNCGCIYDGLYLRSALEKGLITEEKIDTALKNLFRTRFKLGMFDPPEIVPYSKIGEEVINCEKHRQLAYQTAVKSLVLLKNADNILPLGKNLKTIYVIGANAVDIELLLGNYNGYSSRMVTILEGIIGKAGSGTNVKYTSLGKKGKIEIQPWMEKELALTDAIIAVMGITPENEGEEGTVTMETDGEGDRQDISLPKYQEVLINRLCTIGPPVILILTAGSPLEITAIHEKVNAILYVWYPGEEGGNAVGDVLFGNAVPSGRLPLTFPGSIAHLPDFEDYSMKNRTYRYSKAEPLYPFGFGLSYTSFRYDFLQLSSTNIKAGESVTVHLTLSNEGTMDGDEVVQLYLSYPDSEIETPLYALKGFKRVHLNAHESKTVEFTITPEKMQIINNNGEAIHMPGKILVTISGSLPGKRSEALGAARAVSAVFHLK